MQCVVEYNSDFMTHLRTDENTLNRLTKMELIDLNDQILEYLQKNAFPRDVPHWTMQLNAVQKAIRSYNRRH